MSAHCNGVHDAMAALVATVTGLSASTVRRGSPTDSTGRPQPTPPCAYIWFVSLSGVRGPAGRKYTNRVTFGIYIAATATASDPGSKEAAALDLFHLVLAELGPNPSMTGTAHDLESYEVTENGALPGLDGVAPASWVAGTLTIRYDTPGGL